jgi:glucokinase
MIVSDSSFVLSYDVGGSHISAGLCSLSNLELINIVSATLTSVATFDAFADLVHSLGLEAADGEPNIAGASLAVSGPFDTLAGSSLMEHKLTYLYRRDLRCALVESFGFAPDRLCFLNDAAAYVLGEVGGGSIRGARRAAGVTLGTGVGAAFAVDAQHVTSGPGVPPAVKFGTTFMPAASWKISSPPAGSRPTTSPVPAGIAK